MWLPVFAPVAPACFRHHVSKTVQCCVCVYCMCSVTTLFCVGGDFNSTREVSRASVECLCGLSQAFFLKLMDDYVLPGPVMWSVKLVVGLIGSTCHAAFHVFSHIWRKMAPPCGHVSAHSANKKSSKLTQRLSNNNIFITVISLPFIKSNRRYMRFYFIN